MDDTIIENKELIETLKKTIKDIELSVQNGIKHSLVLGKDTINFLKENEPEFFATQIEPYLLDWNKK